MTVVQLGRLLGFNLWALDGLVKLPELYKAVAALEDPAPASEPPTERARFMDLSEAERWEVVEDSLRRQGIVDVEGYVTIDIA